ncbi:hypothetical protein HMI01_13650 [Halolactibacillus miurensis]|uniref:Gas vesicle protein n=1 Tax=Halolactibacillus miurensis TaxID=306541 RepID=A0A1I6T937_9BACI|nr:MULTISPECIES: hypothetical protein [Halolactibacillus]GEM04377.1 hypothetical protein HMI01_13650 [Halolactibacillus miurensis]SFS85736.1 hypothetical protein SAMN05421668_11352 [Halolactibacillus miurensis]
MRNKKMIGFIALGALTGAAISLLDKNVRLECKETLDQRMTECRYYSKHPAELMHQCHKQLAWMMDLSETALDLTVQSVDKVENLLDSIEEKIE